MPIVRHADSTDTRRQAQCFSAHRANKISRQLRLHRERAQLQNDEEKSCTDHVAEHQDHIDVDRDERRDVEVHDLVHLSTPAAWRRST